MKIRFWGTRGSLATPGPGTTHFGGNTSCVEVTTGSGGRLILDCGTGARLLGAELLSTAPRPITGSILLGHTHWDHIQGFPFFAPIFVPGSSFSVYGPQGSRGSLHETLSGQMEFTYFPVELDQLPAQITFHELVEGTFEIGGARVTTQYINHPAVTLAYRIEAEIRRQLDGLLEKPAAGELPLLAPIVLSDVAGTYSRTMARPSATLGGHETS